MHFPELEGRPVEIRFAKAPRDRRGPVHGGAFLRERRITFAAELRHNAREFARIFVHELFHFAWVRLGNPARRSWERVLAREFASGAAGELGWSAEWRKAEVTARDRVLRTRRWREYCCESFCDSAAWLFAGLRSHPEWTLEAVFRARRSRWFVVSGLNRRISI
ncbi:MAG: hypothetical protein M1436_00710 [Acidobacteria bacterium]|nr:hypothetical protein [Acidobacteriota bacterium]